MPSIGRQFGKGEGVPRKDLALAALGLGESREKSVESREGNSDKIRLSADERENVEAAEAVESNVKPWSREQLIVWFAPSVDMPEVYVDEHFTFSSDGTYTYNGTFLEVHDHRRDELPVGMRIKTLLMNKTQVKRLPRGVYAENLYLRETPLEEIENGCEFNVLSLRNTPIKKLPSRMSVNELVLSGADGITDIPSGVSIKELTVFEDQEALIKNAEAKGIRVHKTRRSSY